MSPGLSEGDSFCSTPGAGAVWHQRPVAQACSLSRGTRKLDIYVKSYDFQMLATNATKKKKYFACQRKYTCEPNSLPSDRL